MLTQRVKKKRSDRAILRQPSPTHLAEAVIAALCYLSYTRDEGARCENRSKQALLSWYLGRR